VNCSRTPAGYKKKEIERKGRKPGYWLGPVTGFEPAGSSPACTDRLD